MSDETRDRGKLAEEILDRLASDEGFRRELLDNPAATLANLGYKTDDQVAGYGFAVAGQNVTLGLSCGPFCKPPVTTDAITCGPVATTAMDCGEPGAPPSNTALRDPNAATADQAPMPPPRMP